MLTIEKKVIFLDVDGTILMEDGTVPESTVTACQQARKNGHLVFLCTGRSKVALYPNIIEIGFDGIIGGAGVFAEINGESLFQKTLTVAQVKELVDVFNKKGIEFMIETNERMYGNPSLKEHYLKIIEEDLKNGEFSDITQHPLQHLIEITSFDEESLYRDDINKICFMEHKEIPYQYIADTFGDKLTVVPTSFAKFGAEGGEISGLGIHKAAGIQAVLEHLGLSKEQTIAIGDGINDLEMLQFCQIGIAMGNAKEELKDVADEVTSRIEDDGVYQSFKKHGLI
ncbi:hypothetical protein AJ85_08195 [Alkalihalobacillus alcalophilus ATCC 27647 = CGMCC 1.3604]|uniref:Hydrolase n=1 Tax=Alkalihalobacillus alcalophilus ATCC 27647 = CGMCC 1.3604 TaxID=1218173 RepID=A0A4S4K007_ALKAL|nr:Cof-type HAD-IIB family hydrolase [Alkalihalobacillus alcalophilus]MED1562321.1 Cof-type HAD-IIB family hydrolase [Alkalihalobacillus alcalophilus]THG90905.1 hypothetical protein AJ85_08195 [Alkalihalobacillus alcalophilus ATCC 27647 = CGMCC 1.3604]